MSLLVTDCPRCGAERITFDLMQSKYIKTEFTWQKWYEAFCVCRCCNRSTVFVISQKDPKDKYISQEWFISYDGIVNDCMFIVNYICIKDMDNTPPPEHLPDNIEKAFSEGAACMSIGCWNAAGTMFRLCIDLATRSMLPERPKDGEDDAEGLNTKTRRDLGLRLPWLFDNNLLPEALRDLSSCIKDDGNDGAHAGTLTKEDAEDLLDFTYEFLERIYTEPKRLLLAKERRDQRRKKPDEAETES